ncbi:MAG: thermonuclease family protein [Alphaproteobacteria bacterium]|nr:thermonuclease family protein [Alphaproteobacteria bacterium]
MKRSLTLAALLFLLAFGGPAAASDPPAPTQDIRVIDGDTVEIDGESIRLKDLDAPETGHRARCRRERIAGENATRALQGLVQRSRTVTVTRTGDGGYGRTEAFLTVDGVDVTDWMIAQGHGVRWVPGRQHNWCAEKRR